MGAEERIAEAHEQLGEKADGTPKAPAKPGPPVYDERGNVRPRGTKGARPMSFEERKRIAEGIEAGKKAARKGARTPRTRTRR